MHPMQYFLRDSEIALHSETLQGRNAFALLQFEI